MAYENAQADCQIVRKGRGMVDFRKLVKLSWSDIIYPASDQQEIKLPLLFRGIYPHRSHGWALIS